MKGKITKDILLRVGQGVMRIPRNSDESGLLKPVPFAPEHKPSTDNKKSTPTSKLDRS